MERDGKINGDMAQKRLLYSSIHSSRPQYRTMSLKLTVKTLKGEKFQVDVEPSNTVAEVKGIVVRNFSQR
jgi:hypothetical protein